jgi:hypothetical protein
LIPFPVSEVTGLKNGLGFCGNDGIDRGPVRENAAENAQQNSTIF